MEHVLRVYLGSHKHERPPPASKRAVRSNETRVANIAPRSVPSDHLTGQYIRQGSKLTGPVTLLLVHRAATTKAKASTFVLRVLDDGRRSYVSSLWDSSSPGTYAIEYRGIRYAVTLTADLATFAPSGGGTVNSNVPPVVKIDNTPLGSCSPVDPCP